MTQLRDFLLQFRDFLLNNPFAWIGPLVVFSITLALGYGARRVLARTLRTWTERSRSRAALTVSESLLGPFMLWVLILALHLSIRISHLPPDLARGMSIVLMILWIFSLTLMFARLAGNLIRYYGSDVPSALPVTTLTQTLAQLAVVVLGILVLLSQLGYSITPILTALGVGGLAVALALQDTLSNLFAGFYVAIAGQVRLGDYIKLDSGQEGYVTDIGWRSTTIRALANNLIIVPNNKLAQAIVTNYHLPEKRMGISVEVRVSYECDPDQVERLLLEVAQRGAREIPGILSVPPPAVMFDPGFGESGLGFQVNCQVAEFVNQYGARHELRKRIFKRLREEGVPIPFPTRTVHVHRSEDGHQEAPRPD
jgi:small-conductance mechanosensitive channel